MKTSAVYGFEITKGASGTEFQTLTKMGQGSNIVEMAFTAGSLYALQTGSTSLAVIWPQPRNVSLTSAWDFQLSNSNQSYLPLLKSPSGQPVGFAVSPREADRFFIAQPRSNLHCVISVKDDHFSEYWFSRDPAGPIRQLTDFEYPASKPPQTFRILVVGTSRVVTAPTAMTDEGPKKNSASMDNYDFHSLRLHTFAKRLEFLLNTQAALDGVSQHFQVLELGRPGAKLSFFVNRQVPPLVKKYDVDMVLALLAPTFEEGFSNYFTSPLNDEGIPGEADPEYLLKPWKDRVPSGAPQQLLEKCFKLHLVQEDKNQQLKFAFFQDLLNQGRSDVRNDLLEMLGKPLQVLDQHLKNMKVASTGRQAQLKFFFVPDPDCDNLENYRAFWSDLCTQKGLDLLDLTQPYEDLKYSYYPVTEACCHQHYTAYGNELIAQLLLHYLPQKGWVPLGPAYQGK
jgi:hypothetical protein